MDSAFILTEKLRKAEQDIKVLRELTDWTVAIIVAAGGKVFVPETIAAEASQMKWRREADIGNGMSFEAWV